MIAKYDGSCDRCGKPIYADVDEIKMTSAFKSGAWHHADCNDLAQILHTCQSGSTPDQIEYNNYFAECAGCTAGVQLGAVR